MKKKQPVKPSSASTIHIKMDHYEAIEGKKDLLNSELSLLRISKAISNYKNLRMTELDKKRKIVKKFSEVKRNLTHLQKLLPALRIPKILEKEVPAKVIEKEEKEIEINLEKKGRTIDDDLLEIQRKLERLNQ